MNNTMFNVNDFVRVTRYPVVEQGTLTQGRHIVSSQDPDYEARIVFIDEKYIHIANLNMPFMGTISTLIPIDRAHEFIE